MTTGERNVLGWIERADFDGTGCRHSQQTIAEALGYTRQHVNRCVQSLAKSGRLTLTKERRPGARWTHNVYRAAVWNPHRRSGVLNVLGSIRKRRLAQCDTERTAKPSRAHTPVVHLSPRCRCRSARTLRARTGLEVEVAKDCLDCQRAAELHTELTEELSAAIAVARREAKGRLAADRRLSEFAKADPAVQDLVDLIERWKQKTGHPTAKTRVDDTRGRAVLKALRTYSKIELYEMIDGIALAPFVKFGKRRIVGAENERYDTLEFVLKSDERVWECIEIARRAGSASIDALYMAWQRVAALEREYMTRFQRHPGWFDFARDMMAEMDSRREAA